MLRATGHNLLSSDIDKSVQQGNLLTEKITFVKNCINATNDKTKNSKVESKIAAQAKEITELKIGGFCDSKSCY